MNNTADGLIDRTLCLTGVLYYPTLAQNLISVSQLVDDGYVFKFSKYVSEFIDSNGNTFAAAPRKCNTYYLQCSG